MQLKALLACVAVEKLFQLWLSTVETVVAPITGIYLGFTIDATAVFLMGIGASGVVGLAPLTKPLAPLTKPPITKPM